MYISEIRTKAPADERMPLERKFYDTLEKLKIPYEHNLLFAGNAGRQSI